MEGGEAIAFGVELQPPASLGVEGVALRQPACIRVGYAHTEPILAWVDDPRDVEPEGPPGAGAHRPTVDPHLRSQPHRAQIENEFALAWWGAFAESAG